MPGKDGTGPRWSRFGKGGCRRSNFASNTTSKDRITYLENLKKEINLEIESIKEQEKING